MGAIRWINRGHFGANRQVDYRVVQVVIAATRTKCTSGVLEGDPADYWSVRRRTSVDRLNGLARGTIHPPVSRL